MNKILNLVDIKIMNDSLINLISDKVFHLKTENCKHKHIDGRMQI